MKEALKMDNGKVQGVYMNPRYRILTIDEQSYILDMGRPFWKILFPFFYWILPNTAYKVNDRELIEKVKAPEVKQNKTAGEGALAGLIGVLLANLLQPLVNFFDIESSPVVNSIIVAIVFLIVLSVYFYINIRSKKSLSKVVALKQHSSVRLWIRPQSWKHFSFIAFSYLLFMGLTILGLGSFIQFPNTFILFGGMFFLFASLFISILVFALGDNKVVFKDDKKKAV